MNATPRTITLPADLYDALVAKGWLVDDTEKASE